MNKYSFLSIDNVVYVRSMSYVECTGCVFISLCDRGLVDSRVTDICCSHYELDENKFTKFIEIRLYYILWQYINY